MKDLLTNDNPIYVSPTLAAMLGLPTAIFLERFHSLLQESQSKMDGKPWIEANSGVLGKALPFMAQSQVRHIVKRLYKLQLIEIYLRDGKKWYTLDYARLENGLAMYQAKHGDVTKGGEAL